MSFHFVQGQLTNEGGRLASGGKTGPGDMRTNEISVILHGPLKARATSRRYLLTYHIAFVSV